MSRRKIVWIKFSFGEECACDIGNVKPNWTAVQHSRHSTDNDRFLSKHINHFTSRASVTLLCLSTSYCTISISLWLDKSLPRGFTAIEIQIPWNGVAKVIFVSILTYFLLKREAGLKHKHGQENFYRSCLFAPCTKQRRYFIIHCEAFLTSFPPTDRMKNNMSLHLFLI